MALLFILIVANSVTWFALSILLLRNIWTLGANVTTIESWEIARHETLFRRARASGGYLDGPDGVKVRITKQEFPYDIGIFRNIRQGMGRNPLFWLWPFATTLSNDAGLQFETNGFEGTNVVISCGVIAHHFRSFIVVASSRPRSNPKADEKTRTRCSIYVR